ncbi:MAG TPA: hypothetical protein VFJ77_04615 [Gaiellaceae bacterium]|nr:hypothetical protein [Gaiellaceae bacterium]
MNALSSTGNAETTAARPAQRLSAALPLVSVYATLCLVYAVEAWSRPTPWLFTDELELTQLSRAIAATGHAARRGEAHSPDSIYTVLTAPFWLLHGVAAPYAAIKYVQVFAMASVIFPTYLLARLVVRRRAALFAAAGAAAIPSLAYSSYLVEETLSYPYAAWCCYFAAKACLDWHRGRRPSRWAVAAVVAALLAPTVKGELLVVPLLLFLAAVFWAWSSERVRSRRRVWSPGDHLGLALLVLGAVFVVSAVASKHSSEWYTTTTFYKHRVLVTGGWAAAALAIGTGVLPLLATLAALVPTRENRDDRGLRAFRAVTLAALIAFGTYTSMKAAYLSTVFATRVEERNLIYVAPLLFVGTAVVLERRRIHPLALAASTLFTLYLVAYAGYHMVGSPYEMGLQLYSDSLGLGILQAANRYLYLSIGEARVLLLVVVALAVAVVVVCRSRGSAARVVAAVAAVAVVCWNLAGELGAAAGSVSIGRTQATTLGSPYDWVDARTGGAPTVYLGSGEVDQTAEWLLEFWNRSITRVSSLDGSVDGPGPSNGPNVLTDGTLVWDDAPGAYDFAVEDRPCIQLSGATVASHRYRAGGREQTWSLVRLDHPTRLVAMCDGLYPDGWSGPSDSRYLRFAGGRGHWLRIEVSRKAWSGPSDPSPVHILLSRLAVVDAYPTAGTLLQQQDGSVDAGKESTFWVEAPSDQFAVKVVIDRKFVPSEVGNSSDDRQLGAQITYTLLDHGPRPSRR